VCSSDPEGEIDSDIHGFIISAPASFTPFTKPDNNIWSVVSPDIILFIYVLIGLAITS